MKTDSRKLKAPLQSAKRIEDKIYLIRGIKVIIDRDLAEIYGVTTKRLKEQIKRNQAKFPEDFMLVLTSKEAEEFFRSRSQIATLKRGQNIKYRPFAFTEYGALQAANVLNSPKATAMSVYVIRAFVRLKELIAANQIFEARLSEIEKMLLDHDTALVDIYRKIRPLLTAPPQKTDAVGFRISGGRIGKIG